MSQTINTFWECVACQTQNALAIKKPGPCEPTIVNGECKECKSGYLVAFSKVPGQHAVKYYLNNHRFSDLGFEIIKKRSDLTKAKKDEQTLLKLKQEEKK